MDKDLWKAMRMALKVDFLRNKEEIQHYTAALFLAMKWAKSVNKKGASLQEKKSQPPHTINIANILKTLI